ncbi:hypothetical protein ACFQBU_18600 [Jhaorihella thermophila]|uniref:Sulfotransferase domain-containing protein n=2 Tax=Jhaorihella thermophila TaxID=488547 RepID=A0A1H5Z3N3_9RHOB|nr:hypothetical protein SAMN05421751_12814 [Jhaorihella thermophila]
MTDIPPRVFINSLPKAGTNLVSRAFDLAGVPYGKLGIAGTLLLGDRYYVRQLLRRSFFERDPVMVGLDVQMPVRRAWLERRLSRVPEGGYVTGHANWSMGLEDLLAAHGFRTLVVIRDPRDVLLSHGHYVATSKAHFLKATYSRLSITERTLLTLKGGRIDGLDVAPFTTMLERIDHWIGRPSVEVVRFEDIVGQRGGGSVERQHAVFDMLSRLTGRTFDPARMDAELYGRSHTFRKGKIGTAAEELDADTLARVDEELELMRRKWGYTDD